MKQLIQNWPLLSVLILIAACQSQVEKAEKTTNKFDDPELVKIYELIDHRNTNELIPYLTSKNDNYRIEAALGFGSIQDTATIARLSISLNDDNPKVRRAAAYALGQTYDTTAIAPLVKSLEEEDSVYVRQEMLEALGKVITQEELRMLQYWPLKTSADKKGLAWGLYRAGIRNVHDGISIDIALSLLDSSNSYLTRLGAAQFLARSKNLDLTGRSAFIIRSATRDISSFVRMACAQALGKLNDKNTFNALSALSQASDYRTRINAVRSISHFDFQQLVPVFEKALGDKNVNVAIAAAEQIEIVAGKKDLESIKTLQNEKLNWRVKALLYGTILKLAENKEEVISEIETIFKQTENEYYKASLIRALGNSILANEFIITKTFLKIPSPIATAGIESLAGLRYSQDFPSKLIKPFADVFKQAIETKDIAMVGVACAVLGDSSLGFKSEYESFDFLNNVRADLSLPKDMEAIQLLDRTIAYFEGTAYEPPKNEYNHPIDWELVKQISKDQKVSVKTDKGEIIMRLLVEDAPGSVANFVALAKQGYYNGKNFHRVVPNFVVQGGCNRGDGYGGEDYSIRSELTNLRYEEGSVGMASAGKDTEGTQWFITHSPTPHLDGKYTIFAQVIEGMEVVHQLEVGDKIVSIALK
ncbi:MAG TPA: peptidylprolyl isomerase [Fulvivirga sp.]|nr:peptidylprolyl isomerase [Fulvivirga sp.]